MTVSIQLTQGQVATVDDVDAELAELSWYASRGYNTKTFYAQRSVRMDGQKTTQYLHSVIAGRKGIVGDPDHVDRNGLNNTRDNLRQATSSQNKANQGLQSNNTSGVKGVSFHKGSGRWEARVKIKGKSHHLGMYDDLTEAGEAVKSAREHAFGEFACHK